MSLFEVEDAYDQAFSGKPTHVVGHTGQTEIFDVGMWSSQPDWVDRELFIEPCTGATIDVGCGPGRLVGELAARHITAMGIDVSAEAVRQTRDRGALAIRRDIFARIPGEGRWEHALLADGNLGIGGDPARLLMRLAELLRPGGTVITEVAGPGTGVDRHMRRLRVDGRLSSPFAWAVVGVDAIGEVADLAGMAVQETSEVGGRFTATLVRATT